MNIAFFLAMSFESFLKSIYDFVSSNMQKIIEVDFTVVYSLAFLSIIAWAIVVLISKSFCYTTRISKDCRKVSRFIKKHKEINEENVDLFTKKCFGKNCVKAVRFGWEAYNNERFGFPSEYITYSQCLTRHRVGRGISRSRILAFRYGSGFISLFGLAYILHYINNVTQPIRIVPGMALLAITTIVCDFIINTVFSYADNFAVENFYKMQERLDAFVNLQQIDASEYAGEDYYDELTSEETPAQPAVAPVKEQTVTEPIRAKAPVYKPIEPVKAEPVKAPAKAKPTPAEPVAKKPSHGKLELTKADKVGKLVDNAIAINAKRETYIQLAKMILAASEECTDPKEKQKLKDSAGKLMKKIKANK